MHLPHACELSASLQPPSLFAFLLLQPRPTRHTSALSELGHSASFLLGFVSCQLDTNLDFSGKREFQLRKCLRKITRMQVWGERFLD